MATNTGREHGHLTTLPVFMAHVHSPQMRSQPVNARVILDTHIHGPLMGCERGKCVPGFRLPYAVAINSEAATQQFIAQRLQFVSTE